jgi:hypothetical protein
LGISISELFHKNGNDSPRKIVAEYEYKTAEGRHAFQVVRFEPKTFRQRHKVNGRWLWKMAGVELLPFHLLELRGAIADERTIYIVEGEKDVLAMEGHGYAATCNPGGAGKWKDSYSQHFEGAHVVIIADKDVPGRKHAQDVAQKLTGVAASIKVIELPDVNGQSVKDASDYFDAGGGEVDRLTEAAPFWTNNASADPFDCLRTGPEIDSMLAKLKARMFSVAQRPAPPTVCYKSRETDVATGGNVCTIAGPPKSAKTAVVEAMEASVITPHPEQVDCLGFSARNPDGKAVIRVDTELSPYDHDLSERRVLRRAKLTEPPPWLRSYTIAGFTADEARQALLAALFDAKQFGGVHSVLIDGIADLVNDVNDPAECNVFVAELHALAIRFNCSVVVVIHVNPTEKNPGTGKTRGHLGSQLERKSETNLRLDRDGNAIVIWSDKNRGAPIPWDKGPRFTWDDNARMFLSTDTIGETKEQADRSILRDEAEAVFSRAGKASLSWGDFLSGLVKESRLSDSGARKRMEKMRKAKVIAKQVSGFYALTPNANATI